MRESRLWEWVERKRPAWLAIERFEPMFPPGMADCFWTDRRTRISGWLELKQCDITDKEYRAGRIPKISAEQPMFLRRQAENGAPAGLLLRVVGKGFYLWIATRDREWSNMMRSSEAIANPSAVFGMGQEEVFMEDIMMHLLP